MRRSHVLLATAVLLLVMGLAGFLTRNRWLAWDTLSPSPGPTGKEHTHDSQDRLQRVQITPQAQANLRLVSKPLKVSTFWRTIQIPGTVVDRPAYSDRNVIAPVTGVVLKVHHFPGDTVRPGDPLVTLRLVSETLHLAQTELFKNYQEIAITKEKKNRLAGLAVSGAVASATMIEVDNQLQRLTIADKAYRQELQVRGLTPEQINGVAEGTFVAEIVINVPRDFRPDKKLLSGLVADSAGDTDPRPAFEIQELKVDLGQHVQAGQTLVLVSNHQTLYIEGRGFRQETALVERAAQQGWPLDVDFLEEPGGTWPALTQEFVIRHIGNNIDPATRTFAFFLPLVNQSRSFEKAGKTFLLWRFRPGQKVRLHVKVEMLANVFVVPAAAVVYEGPEAYVFRQNGDSFDRKPVHVVYQDRNQAVIANDGSVPPGVFVAQQGAASLNRLLTAQAGSGSSFHVHADGTAHAGH